MDPVRCPYGRRTGPAWESSMFFVSYGTRAEPTRVPCGTLTIDTSRNCKNTGSFMWPHGSRTGPLHSPHGLFTGCLRSLNSYGARKLIMYALKLYGPRTWGQNSYCAARGPCGPCVSTYYFCLKQPGNSPGTARTGPGIMMRLGH